MEQNERKITIRIGEREYAVKSSSPEHEETVRKAADMLNTKLSALRSKYIKASDVDILSIVAINQCVENVGLLKELENFQTGVTGMEEEVEGYLKNIGY